MLKGVTKRTIEIKIPESKYFDTALLFIKPNAAKNQAFCKQEAKKLIESVTDVDTDKRLKRMQTLIAVLCISLGVCMAAFVAVLVLYTKTML